MRDNVLPLPYKEPSQVLYSLLGTIVEEGRRFASAADMKISDMSANSPVGTTLAILERTLKVMSAVQARVHYSMKQELKLLKEIIRDYTPADYPYEPEIGSRRAKQADYDMVDVIPVSDPNAATMSQKVVQYQAALQLAQSSPDLYDMAQLHRQMLEVLGIKNADKLIKLEEDKKPQDPVTENQNALMLQPIKAFYYQDHQAHIQVHMSAMQDPKIMQLVGQSPQAQQIGAAMQAHIAEHLGFEYKKQMEQMMGMEIPTEYAENEEEIPRELEVRISQMAAQAGQQLLQKNQAEAQQQQAAQQQQDPLIQLQQQELQLKAQEVDIKKQKLQVDAAAKADQQDIERERIAAQERIAGMQVGAKVASDKAQLASKDQLEGLRIGAEISRNQAQMKQQKPNKKGE
jgi:hypothetical protein